MFSSASSGPEETELMDVDPESSQAMIEDVS